ncbi:MAG TPA: DUF4234 domain-containing protein [Epulopiscium sp.]|nr:DUF4234 domain-containing protein [Candidatus Epulonipiscium sp.]
MEKRSVGLSLLFAILTCGLYTIYWFIKITDEANALSGEEGTSGGVSFLLVLVTCGIYTLFWNYKMGKAIHKAQYKAGVAATDNSVLYLVLSIFGLGIIPYCIIQSDINALV